MNTDAMAMHSLSVPALLPTYAPYPFTVVRGARDQVFDSQGDAYWDFYGGHCVCSTGHAHPAVASAIAAQAKELLFYSTAAQIPIRDEAAQALIAFARSPFASVFFCNSGAEANENALKVASKLTGRFRFTSFSGGWHGRTTLALSVTDDPKLRPSVQPFLAPVDFLPFGDEAALSSYDFSQSAGVILEPIQSMAGIRTAPASFFEALRKACDASGSILIFDEVQTGVGRLGAPYASSFYGVYPDLATSAKGIASGVPMGALLMTESVAKRLSMGDLGSTFGGGPLACAALLATLQVIESEGLMQHASAVASLLRKELSGSVIEKVHGEGLLLGLRVSGGGALLKKHLLEHHILVGASGDPEVLRLMPPLNISDAALDALFSAIQSFKK